MGEQIGPHNLEKALHILTGSSHGCFHPYTTAPYKTSYRNIYTNYMFPFNCILIYLISLISRSNELIVLRNSSIDACLLVEFCKNLTGHYNKNSLLSQFHRAICPGFGTGIRLPGGFCPGWQNRDKMSHTLKFFLHPAVFDPKTSCLVHGFLANSPK